MTMANFDSWGHHYQLWQAMGCSLNFVEFHTFLKLGVSGIIKNTEIELYVHVATYIVYICSMTCWYTDYVKPVTNFD